MLKAATLTDWDILCPLSAAGRSAFVVVGQIVVHVIARGNH
jgi:hypothetical protein